MESLSFAIVKTVADKERVDPAELTEPLGDVIDTDALDSLFTDNVCELTFHYHGYEITVDETGAIEAKPLHNTKIG